MRFFEEGSIHSVAEEYINLIKKTLARNGNVKYDAGDFLALYQHDRKWVLRTLLEYEHGYKIVESLKGHIKDSLMSEEDRDELLKMTVQPKEVCASMPGNFMPEEPEEKPTLLGRFFSFLKRG